MKLATPPPGYSPDDQARLRGALEREDLRNVKTGAAQAAVYLIATDTGATMKGTVDSAGTLTWTPVSR